MKGKSFGLILTLMVFSMVFSCASEDTVEPEKPDGKEIPETKTDTVYVRDTMYVRDTVHVSDTVVVGDTEPRMLEFQLLASQNLSTYCSMNSVDLV